MNNSIVIDGIIFSLQRYGGISVYFKHLVNELAISDLAFELAIESPQMQCLSDLPKNSHIVERKARMLERFRLARLPSDASLFHSSYYRLPERSDVPSVVTVHDFIYERFRKGPRKWAHIIQKHAAIRAAQAVICISEATRQDLIEFVGETAGQTVHVIHNGVADTFQPARNELAEGRFMLFVGERSGYKNFKLVLTILKRLPDLELYCVGGGSLRPDELKGLDDRLHARIHHFGFVADETLNTFYNSAFCLIYPSIYEGFGIPVIEAMRAGCPVVSVPCAAVQEVGGYALTVSDSAEECALTDAVLQLYSSEFRRAKINLGLEIAQRYSWKKTHLRTLDVYRSLGANLPGSQPT
jgi:mannosyltransferase